MHIVLCSLSKNIFKLSLFITHKKKVYDIAKVNTWLRDNSASGGGGSGSPGGNGGKSAPGSTGTHYTLLNKKDAACKKRLTKLASITISEDEDNYDSSLNNANKRDAKNNNSATNTNTNEDANSKNSNSKQLHHQQEVASEDSSVTNGHQQSNDEDQNANERESNRSSSVVKAPGSTYETNDSAIDMRSYG
jgi:hypothetical protein